MWSRQKPIYLPIFLLTLFGPIYYLLWSPVIVIVTTQSHRNNAGAGRKHHFFPPAARANTYFFLEDRICKLRAILFGLYIIMTPAAAEYTFFI